MRVVKILLVLVAVVSAMVATGCQVDVQGPSLTSKLLYKGENGNREFLSRGSGQTGGSSYAAGGGTMLSNGANGSQGIWSWGNNTCETKK